MKRTMLACALALAASAPAAADIIDFSDLTPGTTISGPLVYPNATFSSSSGQFFVGAAGVDDEICTFTGNCEAALTVTFNNPVNNLRFQSNGEQSSASQLFLSIISMSGNNNLTLTPFDGNFSSFDTVDLSAFLGITSFVVTTDDGAGVAFDNFSFDTAAAVPEPSTWAMMLMGFGGIGFAMRRRRTQQKTAMLA